MIDKQKLRKVASATRKNVALRVQKDCKITQKMIELLKAEYDTVFCYVSFGTEVDTKALIEKLRDSVKIFVPHTYNGKMKAVMLKEETTVLAVDKQGNLYGESEQVTELLGNPKACVVPLLAYNDNNYRLGYGGGYYDKYLSTHDTLKIGVCYDEQYFDFEREPFDVAMDIIVTPTKIIRR